MCTSTYTGFGALISEELSYKVKGWISVGLILANVLLYPEVLTEFNFFLMLPSLLEGLPGVLWVLPDSYLDVPNKDYGGRYLLFLPWVKFHWSVWIQPDHNSLWFYFVAQYLSYKRGVSLVYIVWFGICLHWDHVCYLAGDLFVDGKVIHRPQFRFNERQQVRSRPRPRYDRRREIAQVEPRETMQRGPSTTQQQRPPCPQEAATQNQEQHWNHAGRSRKAASVWEDLYGWSRQLLIYI